jgi:hypothetical protein
MTIYFTSQFRHENKREIVKAFVKNNFNFDIILGEFPTKPIYANDILIGWNRIAKHEALMQMFEKAGARIILLENPYIYSETEKLYAVNQFQHNNYKYSIPCKDNGERFAEFGLEMKPWRTSGEHILMTTQAKTLDARGLGSDHTAQPAEWDSETIREIRKYSNRPIIFRTHPNSTTYPIDIDKQFSNVTLEIGKNVPIAHSLKNAHCLVTHSSNAIVEALLEGIPTVHTGFNIIMRNSASYGTDTIEKPVMLSNRLPNFNKLAWNQYSLDEIASGKLFEILKI